MKFVLHFVCNISMLFLKQRTKFFYKTFTRVRGAASKFFLLQPSGHKLVTMLLCNLFSCSDSVGWQICLMLLCLTTTTTIYDELFYLPTSCTCKAGKLQLFSSKKQTAGILKYLVQFSGIILEVDTSFQEIC